MEMREWAICILGAETLETKLFRPSELTDLEPGPPLLWKEPARPTSMRFKPHTRKDRLPPMHDLASPEKRAVCLHRFAGHELLAVEIMAYTLLAFPEAPPSFRKGVAHTLKEEQDHVSLYIKRLQALGLQFGDLPLYRHFWSYISFLTSPLKYISLMSLTFEMANLDFAPMYGHNFALHGDIESEQLMQIILQDEIRHVAFGRNWLCRLKEPGRSEWEEWCANIPNSMPYSRAKGSYFQTQHRKQAGIPSDWIENLRRS